MVLSLQSLFLSAVFCDHLVSRENIEIFVFIRRMKKQYKGHLKTREREKESNLEKEKLIKKTKNKGHRE